MLINLFAQQIIIFAVACAIDWNGNADIQVCRQRRKIDIRKEETGSEKSRKILEQYRESQKNSLRQS